MEVSGDKSQTRVQMKFWKRFGFLKKDLWIIALFIAFISLWILFFGNRHGEGILNRPLRVGIVSWPGYAGGLVANKGLRPSKECSFWRAPLKEQALLVEFVLVENEKQRDLDFLIGGDKGGLDVIWSTVDALPIQISRFKKKGMEVRAFMQVDWSRGGDAIVARADIKNIEDLKGHAVASSMAASDWFLVNSLKFSTMSESDQRAIYRKRKVMQGSIEACQTFIDMKVDAAVLWEPDVERALKERAGAHVILSTATAEKLIADVMIAKKEFIEKHPKVIKAFIEGWLISGTPEANQNYRETAAILSASEPRFSGLEENQVVDMLNKVKLATLEDNTEMFGLDGSKPLFDSLFNSASERWRELGDLGESIMPGQAREIRILQEVYFAHAPVPYSKNLDPEKGILSNQVALPFQPNEIELSTEVKQILDDERFQFFLKSHGGAWFIVQGKVYEKDDPERAYEISVARATAVARYLEERLNRPLIEFRPLRTDKNAASRNTASQVVMQFSAFVKE